MYIMVKFGKGIILILENNLIYRFIKYLYNVEFGWLFYLWNKYKGYTHVHPLIQNEL